ncbi:amino acid adenylation domain-containing protein [Marinomonas sp. THO17]|uniref:amino acid adenylation domain-containing protein n=1 Tax=Marinomonas sp. THO17 TaxID=3149048 RepID=UPI00336BD826
MSIEDLCNADVSDQVCPLSASQQRLWMFHQLKPNSLAYNIGGLLWFDDPRLSPDRLQQALLYMVADHPAFTITIDDSTGTPLQKYNSPDLDIEVHDLRHHQNPYDWLKQDARQKAYSPYQLTNSRLLRLGIYQISDQSYAVLLALHHLIGDAWSLSLCCKSILSYLKGVSAKTKTGEDFFSHARRSKSPEELDDAQQKWQSLELLSDEPLQLKPQSTITDASYQAGHIENTLSPSQTQMVDNAAKTLGVTKFELLSSALLLTLSLYANHPHPAIIVPTLNRNSNNRRNVGFYVGNAVLGLSIKTTDTFNDIIQAVREKLAKSISFEGFSAEQLCTQQSLPNYAFNYRTHGDGLTVKVANYQLTFEEFPVVETPFELVLDAISHTQLTVRFVYAAEKYPEDFILRLIDSYQHILLQLCQAPEQKKAQVNLLGEKEQALLKPLSPLAPDWNPVVFTDLLSRQAKDHSKQIALQHGSQTLSYGELEKQSNQLAHYLVASGVQADGIVGIMMERGIQLFVTMIAVLKAGGAFLPLDPDYPEQRLNFMLNDSDALLLLTQNTLIEQGKQLTNKPVIAIESLSLKHQPISAPNIKPHPLHLAYVIYTSGSTGTPKGVAINHQGLSMHVQTIGKDYDMTPADTELHFASISFDGAIERWTVPLAFGARLIIRDQALWTAEQTTQILLQEKVTIACFPPSYIGPLLDWIADSNTSLPDLRSLTLGGEAFTRETFERIQQVIKPPRIINGYGPTETVVTPLIWRAYAEDALTSAYAPIGSPVGARQLYILDNQLQPLPAGTIGELYIGLEVGLARGYLNQAGLSAERFLADPFSANGERMYRTGDLVRLNEQGIIEYFGRVDQQVKIRGFRIELGEIESRLQALTNAKLCAVITQDSPSGKKLVAYVQSQASQQDAQNWLAALSQQLPDYMVPSHIVIEAQLPITPAGKIDRKNLPAPQWQALQQAQSLCRLSTPRQHLLASLWQSLLNVPSIGADSHFFALGGDSISALQLVGKLRQQHLMLTPKQVFEHPVLSDMAECVIDNQTQPAQQGLLTGEVSLLPMQSRFVAQYALSLCNQFARFVLPAPIDINALQLALSQVLQHHDALRLAFTLPQGSNQATARYLEDGKFTLQTYAQQIDDHKVHSALQPETGCLLSLGVNLQEGEVLLAVHHLVIDALSWPVLLEDLIQLYQGVLDKNRPALAAKTHHQEDWYQALKSYQLTQQEIQYWQAQQGAAHFPAKRSTAQTHQWLLPKHQADALFSSTQGFARMDKETSLMSLVVQGIASLTSLTRLTLHKESHGRFAEPFQLDLSRSVNWHTALYPQTIELQETLGDTLAFIKDIACQVPFGGIGYSAGILQEAWSYAPSIDVLFNYLGSAAQHQIADIKINEFGLWRAQDVTADAAITLNLSETKQGILFDLETDEALFDAQQVEQLIQQLASAADTITQYCQHQSPILTTQDAKLTSLTQPNLTQVSHNLLSRQNTQLVDKILPLSALQQGLYFHTQLANNQHTYVNQITLPIEGANADKLLSCWQQLMARHSMLRSTISQIEGQAHFLVWPNLPVSSAYHDVRDQDEVSLNSLQQNLIAQGFNLTQALNHVPQPLWRVDLVQTSEPVLHCIFTIHHLLMDGWSTGVLFAELINLYQGHSLPPVQEDFADYLTWLNQQSSSASQDYWQDYLRQTEAPTLLADLYGQAQPQQGHVRDILQIDTATREQWQHTLKQSGLTLNTLIQGAWLLTLQRYTGQDNPIFGNTVTGRPSSFANSDNMVGLFINTLPITSRIDWQSNTQDWLKNLQDQASQQREFSYSALSDVANCSPLDAGKLFDTLMVFENYPLDKAQLNQGDIRIGEPDSYEFTHYPLTLAVLPDDGLSVIFAYDTACFHAEQIHALQLTTQHFLEQLVRYLTAPLGKIPVLDKGQDAALKAHTKACEPWHYAPFTELLKQQAVQHPQHLALKSNVLVNQGQTAISLSYAELDQQTDAIAASLIQQGIQRENIVGVLCQRGNDMLVSMIGILKAGAAFLPLDPAYPQERLSYMLSDSQAVMLITDSASQSLAQHIAPSIKSMVFDAFDLSLSLTTPPQLLADQLAYVIYTSGSTGQPKGVCVSQLGLSMHVQTIGQRYGMQLDDKELHFASISFDGAIERWATPLAFGSSLVIRDQSLWSAEETCAVLAREEITIACFPPSYVGPLLEWIQSSELAANLKVRSWTLGGEAFTRDTYFALQQTLKPQRIINGYGPTETVVTPLIWQAYPDTQLDSAYAPIGTAVGARDLFVLDKALQPVPSGVSGELYIGDEAGLARGYLARPDLTAERFLPNPFSQQGERLYRTGDLVRWREDGVMEYLGRADDQVKIRGFRIELGEIEARLQQLSGCRQSAVIALDGPSGKVLIGYLESQHTDLDSQAILQQMKLSLPDYMLPSQLIVMDALPLTPASKVDKKRLPLPELSRSSDEYVAPQGELERLLATEWQALLKLEQVSRFDDFFALGGQSLLATQLVGRLQHKHRIQLALQSVFDAPVLSEMAKLCQMSSQDLTIQPITRLPYLAVSAAQKRLWFVQQLMPESAAYHMPLGIKLTGQLDKERLQQALHHLLNKHEIFRTTFAQVEGELMQSIQPQAELPISYHQDAVSTDQIMQWIAEPFDFASAPLLRVHLICQQANEHHLIIILHHIISDGVSIQKVLKEWFECYQALSEGQLIDTNTAPSVDYVDYAAWQQNWLQSAQAQQDLQWWLAALQHEVEPLILHSEVPRDAHPITGKRYHFELSQQQIDNIKQLAQAHHTTVFNIMLTLWQLLMHKYSGQQDIRVGVPVAGRQQAQTQAMQGCFINSLTIPIHIQATSRFSDLINQVSDFVQQALSRQEVPFETLVERLGITGNLQQHPLYQTSFNFQQMDLNPLQQITELDIQLFDPGVVGAQLELSMDIQELALGAEQDGKSAKSKWLGFVNYAAPVFDEDFAKSLLEHWLLLLEQVTTDQQACVADLSLVSSSHRHHIDAYNATQKDWRSLLPAPVSIMQQAQQTPDAIALAMGEDTMTYREFDRKVTQLANWLRKQGVKEESRVGLGLPRSFDLVIGLHAITRAGGAYVPLDPSFPKERLNYILDAAEVSLLLTDQATLTLWPTSAHCQYVTLDTLDTAQESLTPPEVNWQADQALYVIFTSGSTGLPKGVVNTQAALQNRLHWMQHEYQLDAEDCVLQKTPFSFDVSVWEFFWPLMFGARLAIAAPDHHRQPELLHRTIVQHKVTTIHFVPSMLHAFASETDMASCTSLQRIICSGEALPVELVDKVLTQMSDCELHNLYGPTEAAIDVSYWQCQLPTGRRTPIGFPISNTQLHVLDENWNPVPIGVPGELYLAGDGLAREYLSRADLTAERFVPNPWGAAGSRMYRTGDKVLRMADGRLEYLDRLDHQVKIRGLRIELEEIEAVLNQHEEVEESAVIAYDYQIGTQKNTSTQLVAYLVCQHGKAVNEAEIKRHLTDHLPEYMVPALFIPLTSMPLSPSGKRDRKALPSPEWNQVQYRAPESELEQWFAKTWQTILGVDQVGLDDNFFALGGHSLLATKVVALSQKELGLTLSLKDFFAATTLQALTDSLQPHYHSQNESEQDELDAMAALMDDLDML